MFLLLSQRYTTRLMEKRLATSTANQSGISPASRLSKPATRLFAVDVVNEFQADPWDSLFEVDALLGYG